MWNPFRPKEAEVIAHWYALVANFQASTKEFYSGVEAEVELRKVPGLTISKVTFAEGGLLSAEREYLRMTRERLVFDICAAPFGTSYFFSLRFAELPIEVKLWQLLIFLFVLWLPYMMFREIFGAWLGGFLFLLFGVAVISLCRNAVAMGFRDLDQTLLNIPVIGVIYDRILRRETYYRVDTRLMFLESIDAIVRGKVEAVTSAKGVKLLSIKQHAPLLQELYKPTLLRQEPTAETSSDEPTG